MKIEQRDGKWWITGIPDCSSRRLDCGPYDTRKEAESDRVGMKRFERYYDKPGYMTTDRKGK